MNEETFEKFKAYLQKNKNGGGQTRYQTFWICKTYGWKNWNGFDW